MSILRIALKVSADASLRVTKVPKFEPDTEIGQISADFEMGRFEIGSQVGTDNLASSPNNPAILIFRRVYHTQDLLTEASFFYGGTPQISVSH